MTNTNEQNERTESPNQKRVAGLLLHTFNNDFKGSYDIKEDTFSAVRGYGKGDHIKRYDIYVSKTLDFFREGLRMIEKRDISYPLEESSSNLIERYNGLVDRLKRTARGNSSWTLVRSFAVLRRLAKLLGESKSNDNVFFSAGSARAVEKTIEEYAQFKENADRDRKRIAEGGQK